MGELRQVAPIVALDVSDSASALRVVEELGELCRFYKVGAELFTAAGPEIVRLLVSRGCEVFVDLKVHDIPNTARGGCRNAARAGARLITVHAVGGVDMMKAAVSGAREGYTACGVLAVTVLTSLDAMRLAAVWGRPDLVVAEEVERMAGLGVQAGVAGVVCGGAEVARVRRTYGDDLAILVPGVRLEGSPTDDQQRVTTARGARAAGADYIVVGRTVTAAADRRVGMERVIAELR